MSLPLVLETPLQGVSSEFETFIAIRKAEGASPATIENYKAFVYPFLRDYPEFLSHPRESILAFISEPENKWSRFTRLKVLKVFCQFLVEEGMLEKNPAQGIKMSMPGKTANIPPLEEVKRFINALDMKSFTDRRLRVMLLLALDTGLRRGELCGLKQSDIDKDRLALTVCAEYSKVRKSRLVPISLSVFKELKNFISIIPKEWNTPWLFPSNNGQKLDPSNLGLQMRRVAQKVGYDLKLHGLRHLCATEFLRKSGNIVLVSRLLGHSSIRVTADTYEHLNFNDLQSAHSSAGVVSAVLGNKRIRKV